MRCSRKPAPGRAARGVLLILAMALPCQPQAPATPEVPIASLRSQPFGMHAVQTIHGVVTRTGSPLYLQDRSGGMEVRAADTPPSLRIGDEVAVTGVAVPGRYSSGFNATSLRLLRAGVPVPPLSVTPAVAAMGDYDRVFIDTDGFFVRAVTSGSWHAFLLRGSQQTFTAELPPGHAFEDAPAIRPGALLRVRGICVMSDAGTRAPVSFRILLRSHEDLEILAGPPFWTRTHLLLLVVGLLLLACGALLGMRRLERWQFALVLEERARVAHDLHDTLAQNFAGVGFQLQAIRSALRRQKPEAEVQQHVELAIGMVAHSHQHARRSIAMLRPNDLEGGDLLENLREQAVTLTEGGEIRFTVQASGDPVPIPPAVRQTLLRIGHEAITNSIRHAAPAVIAMHLTFRAKEVEFTVCDDGCGFALRATQVRGFGLTGMRARALSHGGTLTITSAPGEGCAVHARLPLGRGLKLPGRRREEPPRREG